jgi:hypothetical protein
MRRKATVNNARKPIFWTLREKMGRVFSQRVLHTSSQRVQAQGAQLIFILNISVSKCLRILDIIKKKSVKG